MIKKLITKILGIDNIMLIKSYFKNSEEKELYRKRKVFYSQLLKKNDTYFDIGANYGNRIEPIINLGIKIVAVEPQKECVKYLKKKFGRKIDIVPYGLGEKEEEKTMYIADASVISSFSQDWIQATKKSGRFSKYKWDIERKIKMKTLDSIIEEYGIPTFIKIDVEGFELEVLKGLSTPIKMISFEYTVPERNDSVYECINRIAEISQNNVVFNYSVGESMEFELNNWISLDDVKSLITSDEFIKTSFGDLYAKYQSE